MIIDISKKNPAAVLAALYNAGKSPTEIVFNLGFPPPPLQKQNLSEEEAQKIIEAFGTNFEYLCGIPLNIDLSYNHLDVTSYDKYNGEGSAQKAIESCPDIEN